jgi:hypothetical protein
MTEEELLHFGVKGMHWGQRQAATGKEVKAARRNLSSQAHTYRQDYKKYARSPEGSARRAKLEKKLRAEEKAYQKDPKRVIAARMTRGEKIATLLTSAETPLTAIAGVGAVVGTSAMSRRIEYKQQHGAYDKTPKSQELKKRIGGAQRARNWSLAGASVMPSLMTSIGKQAASSIGTRAATNRAAAKAAANTKALGSTAAKLAYAKLRRGGVHVITTMK